MRLAFAFLLVVPLAVLAEEEPRPLSDVIFKARTSWATKGKMIVDGGGNSESEAAVVRGLKWLVREQQKDGSWNNDGKAKEDRVSSTSLALLTFLGVGVRENGAKYWETVDSGIKYLISRQKADGSFEKVANIDGHAWATIALCEAAALTKVEGSRPAAEKALACLLKNQQEDGSWGTAKGKLGPVVYLAWPVQAVSVARLARFKVPFEEVYAKVEKFLNSHTWNEGRTYGLAKDEPSDDLTAAAPMIWYFLGRTPLHPAMGRAAEAMSVAFTPITDNNPVLHQRHFFQTQFLGVMGGATWHKAWNPKMRDGLVSGQIKIADENVKGSWLPDAGDFGEQYGRLGCTAMSLLSLEVYYRYMPLYTRDAGGLRELER